MERTTILIPADLKVKAEKYARKNGISLGELIRNSLEFRISQKEPGSDDPFFNDRAVYNGRVPLDMAINHDEYLYGPKR